MECKNCNNSLPDGAKFCGKCGKPVDLNQKINSATKKTVSGIRIFIGIVVAIFVFGGLAKALAIIVNVVIVLLFGIDSTEGLRDVEAVANIVGFVVGACLANLVYISIAGKDTSLEKKKWYQFAGFMRTGNKTKARPILAVVIIVIAFIGFILSSAVDSLKTEREGTSKNTPTGQLNSLNENWIVYNAANGYFSVKLPSRPTHDTKNQDAPTGKVQIDTYKTADNTASVAYIVNVSEFSQETDLSNSTEMLENTVNLSANNGTVVEKNLISHGGYPAIDYLIEFDHETSKSRIRGLNILVGQRLYQLLTAYDVPDESKLEFDKFTNSFEIK